MRRTAWQTDMGRAGGVSSAQQAPSGTEVGRKLHNLHGAAPCRPFTVNFTVNFTDILLIIPGPVISSILSHDHRASEQPERITKPGKIPSKSSSSSVNPRKTSTATSTFKATSRATQTNRTCLCVVRQQPKRQHGFPTSCILQGKAPRGLSPVHEYPPFLPQCITGALLGAFVLWGCAFAKLW